MFSTTLQLLDGVNAGELKFICKRDPNAVSYSFEYTDSLRDENTKWNSKVSSNTEYTFKGLRSGTRIYGRIKIVGRKDQQANSEVLSRMVQ